ncbi:hypothetical protein [Pseudomonas sp. RGM 3321]|uniref:hypothetical protein n=1 Tax=Pseudomonas sp. RGM 3321 TaxID=2930089 RepID=UPI001FCA7797|nr:hypothetical protein [Pseudomonas sp. RGM 3321]MCJ2374438.1 hypothetical protein [Pseudomonas sp. RGM 3321]
MSETMIDVAQLAVRNYFAGERNEMLAILAVSVVLALSAFALYYSSGSGLAKGFLITTLVCAGLMSATALSLMVRDGNAPTNLTVAIGSEQAPQAIASERDRVAVVISKYKYYRYGAGVLGAIALAGLLLSSRGWVHGVAAGLLLLVVAQVLIDHFSERRAHLYHEQLSAWKSS